MPFAWSSNEKTEDPLGNNLLQHNLSSQLLAGLRQRNLDIPDSVDTLFWGPLLQNNIYVHIRILA